MASQSRAIAAFTSLGLLLVAVALGVTHVNRDREGSSAPTVAGAPPSATAPSATPSASAPQYPDYPSETPSSFTPTYDGWDYVRREAEIPMRDGVKLHTVIALPKGATRAPILFTRTPYNADKYVEAADSEHMDVAAASDVPAEALVRHGYIRVVQDVRGKYGSEGDYVMNRPVHGPQNPTPVDAALISAKTFARHAQRERPLR